MQGRVFVDDIVHERALGRLEHQEVLDTGGDSRGELVLASRRVHDDRSEALLVSVPHERVLVRLSCDRDPRPLEPGDVDKALVNVCLLGDSVSWANGRAE